MIRIGASSSIGPRASAPVGLGRTRARVVPVSPRTGRRRRRSPCPRPHRCSSLGEPDLDGVLLGHGVGAHGHGAVLDAMYTPSIQSSRVSPEWERSWVTWRSARPLMVLTVLSSSRRSR